MAIGILLNKKFEIDSFKADTIEGRCGTCFVVFFTKL